MGRAKDFDKREYAEVLYVNRRLTQKEIAEKIGTTEKTISKWKEEDGWEKKRTALFISKSEQLRMMTDQLNELNESIMNKEIGKRFPSPGEADTQVKIAKSIEALTTEANLTETIESFENLLEFIRMVGDIPSAQSVAEWMDKFVRSKMK